MTRPLPVLACVLLVPLVALFADELPMAKPREVGLAPGPLETLKPALEKLVEEGKIPGGVALVARQGKVAYFEPFGFRDLATRAPMTADTIFAIASMTKPVTCIAVMSLVERGEVRLDDPISKYLPELAKLSVLGDPKDDTDDKLATVPANRPLTVRDLLSHTSGLAYGGFLTTDTRLARAYDQEGVQRKDMKTVDEQIRRLARAPLSHQPGARWTYGLSHDVLGRLIEVVSGQPLDVHLRERIFEPLDMIDTSFSVPEAKQDRVATIYRSTLGGKLVALPRTFGSKTFFSGGGGLFSTTRDYARFAQMLANGGTLGKARIIRPETIKAMTTNEIGDNYAFVLFKYGLGFGLEMEPGTNGGAPTLARYFWGGVFSTNFWVDPRRHLIAVIMTQVLPTNHGNAIQVFRKHVNEAVGK